MQCNCVRLTMNAVHYGFSANRSSEQSSTTCLLHYSWYAERYNSIRTTYIASSIQRYWKAQRPILQYRCNYTAYRATYFIVYVKQNFTPE